MGNEEMTLDQAREVRANLQSIINSLENIDGGSRERSLAITKLQEGKMWLGMTMGAIGGEDLNAKRDKDIAESK